MLLGFALGVAATLLVSAVAFVLIAFPPRRGSR